MGTQLSRRRLCGALAGTVSVALAGCSGGAGGNDGDGDGDDGDGTTPPFGECPSLRAADATVCAANADAPVVLRPSATTVTAPGTLQFTLSNGGESTLGMNPYDWAVHRETADGWERVAPDATIEPWREIPPGASQAWMLQVGASHASPANETVVCGPLTLGAGTYAFSVVARADGAWTAYVARFRVA
ncbi:hypothetical protein [Halarchaeum nitratireducens]|uniref:Uncharacterized protein n=1 Tax=Halarchaeum nitratireducens TaxID=489913 RepID=A0A830GAW8_9EURY|nr:MULTISPECIES: hypothetical protein [Halarchaeum]MBP2251536.1 hypothetical protein [Halarchaeum solikamskense]GGN14197.1 hypothetical protein GCM10009021_13030 [Halarchaeum nitratireducens]